MIIDFRFFPDLESKVGECEYQPNRTSKVSNSHIEESKVLFVSTVEPVKPTLVLANVDDPLYHSGATGVRVRIVFRVLAIFTAIGDLITGA